jgi:hypothetical protein
MVPRIVVRRGPPSSGGCLMLMLVLLRRRRRTINERCKLVSKIQRRIRRRELAEGIGDV